jgi:hypothetical protein
MSQRVTRSAEGWGSVKLYAAAADGARNNWRVDVDWRQQGRPRTARFIFSDLMFGGSYR